MTSPHGADFCSWALAPADAAPRRSVNGRLMVTLQRRERAPLFADNPGLTTVDVGRRMQAHAHARWRASAETALALATFPQAAPRTLDEARAEDCRPSGQSPEPLLAVHGGLAPAQPLHA